MKLKHLLIALMLLGLALWVGSLSGCKVTPMYSKWEWEAGTLFLNCNSYEKCRHRVAQLADKMKQAGEPFQLVKARPRVGDGPGHCWIVYRDKVLEPSRSGNPNISFKPFSILYVNQGSAVQDQEAQKFIDEFKDGQN